MLNLQSLMSLSTNNWTKIGTLKLGVSCQSINIGNMSMIGVCIIDVMSLCCELMPALPLSLLDDIAVTSDIESIDTLPMATNPAGGIQVGIAFFFLSLSVSRLQWSLYMTVAVLCKLWVECQWNGR